MIVKQFVVCYTYFKQQVPVHIPVVQFAQLPRVREGRADKKNSPSPTRRVGTHGLKINQVY